MDERLEEALKFAEYRTTLNNQLAQLKHRIDIQLLHSVNGGTFVITMELINFIKLHITAKKKSVILLDKNGTPIKIDDLKEFYQIVFDRYTDATQAMYDEFIQIRKQRKVQSILDIEIGE